MRGRFSGYFRFVFLYLSWCDLEVDEFSAVALSIYRPGVLAFGFLVGYHDDAAVMQLKVVHDWPMILTKIYINHSLRESAGESECKKNQKNSKNFHFPPLRRELQQRTTRLKIFIKTASSLQFISHYRLPLSHSFALWLRKALDWLIDFMFTPAAFPRTEDELTFDNSLPNLMQRNFLSRKRLSRAPWYHRMAREYHVRCYLKNVF